MNLLSPFALVLAGALLVPQAAEAHHSFAMFDRTQTIEKTGIVKEVRWTNPHVWFYIIAPDDKGGTEEWGFETQPTTSLMRSGWKRDTLKPGDKITVTFMPMKNGSHGGNMRTVTLADGTTMGVIARGAKPEEGEEP
jgi:hypothetical protein